MAAPVPSCIDPDGSVALSKVYFGYERALNYVERDMINADTIVLF